MGSLAWAMAPGGISIYFICFAISIEFLTIWQFNEIHEINRNRLFRDSMECIEIPPGAMAQARLPMGPDPGTRVPGSSPMGSLAWAVAPGGDSMYFIYFAISIEFLTIWQLNEIHEMHGNRLFHDTMK